MTNLQQLELQLLADWWPYNMQNVLGLTQLRSLRELILEKYYEPGSIASGFHLLAIKVSLSFAKDCITQAQGSLSCLMSKGGPWHHPVMAQISWH